MVCVMPPPKDDPAGEIHKLQGHYRSGTSDLRKDFFSPCLGRCSRYQRAVGYFSSSALISWSNILPRMLEKAPVRIELLISPELSSDDLLALERALDDEERDVLRQGIADKIIIKALETENALEDVHLRLQLLAWMIANNRINIRFAFPKHVKQPGIFHEKIGIFEFPWGDKIAFTGSANETSSGHFHNYESIDIYREWLVQDKERVQIKIRQFEEAWDSRAPGLLILPLSQQALKKVREYAPVDRPYIIKQKDYTMWRHQDEAVSNFLERKCGVLEMASGTGKTRTAVKILSALVKSNEICGAIVCTTGTDLLDQWCTELDKWVLNQSKSFRVLRHFASYHELENFSLDPEEAILVISREQLNKLFTRLPNEVRPKLAIIHDEIHGLGSPSNQNQLDGRHKDFVYKLGLSATPEREYDEKGNNFILKEIGEVCFHFALEDAIERGILCEFDYVPLTYTLTNSDKQRIQKVYARKVAREKEGNPMSDVDLAIELSRVYKTAEQKPQVFFNYIVSKADILKSAIIFVEERAYGNRILEDIHAFTHLYRTYYAEDDRDNLLEFALGRIDCLITCHRISQGIDIKSIKNIILFSSARAKLETIQRIGRCLRIDPNLPNKRATVIDFVLFKEDGKGKMNADEERYKWLLQISKTRRKE